MTLPDNPDEPGKGRTLYAEFIKEQLDYQEVRKDSLEKRGLAVITTSGALVTLLFALTALSVKRAATFDIPDASNVFLVAALGFFVVAALLALVTNLPRSYEAPTVNALQGAVTNRWADSETTASKMVAETRLKMLASAKDVNGQKGMALAASVVVEIIAVALVAVAMAFVLFD